MKHVYAFTLLITTSILHAADTQQLLFALTQSNNPEEILEQLKLKNFDINAPIDYYEETALHHACGLLNCASLTKALLAHGANVDAQNSINGETPLHYAAGCGHSAIVKILLEYGAHRNKETYTNKTPADFAREKGYEEIANLIDNWEDLPDTKEPADVD
jgi:ankyrin repeat protein